MVWEEYYGRDVPAGYHIHHINGIRNDNRIENLLALPASEHIYRNLKDARLKRKEFLAEMERLREENAQLKERLACFG